MASRLQIEAAARAVEPLMPYRNASSNGPISELSDGSFVHLITLKVAKAALEAVEQ